VVAGGGTARIEGVPAGASVGWSLPQVGVRETRLRYLVRVARSAGSDPWNLRTTLRADRSGAGYAVDLQVDADQALSWSVARTSPDGRERTLGTASTVGRLGPERWRMVEVSVTGDEPVAVRARTWSVGDVAPHWDAVLADSAADRLRGPGTVGVAVRSGTRPAPGVEFADLTVVDLRDRGAEGLPTLVSSRQDGFVHPGVVDGSSSLSLARGAARAGREPWASALDQVRRSRFADPAWAPQPVAVVACGANTMPDLGCTAETDDAQAAYTQALLWYFTGDRRYARGAADVLNAWSAVLERHEFDETRYVNGRLQAAWSALTFTRAAELLRYSGSGWSEQDAARFEDLLVSAFLPNVQDGWTGGGANGQLAMASATMAIGVFVQDWSVFDDGVADWRDQVRAAVYVTSDGPEPVAPAGTVFADRRGSSRLVEYWQGVPEFVDGIEQETCRDSGHMAMGFAAAFQGAETAGLQGIDLYRLEQRRLVAGMEYNTRFLNDPGAPGWVCPQAPRPGGDFWRMTWEAAFRHYTALGVPLPQTAELLGASRPTGSALFVNWETLTHGTAE